MQEKAAWFVMIGIAVILGGFILAAAVVGLLLNSVGNPAP